MGPGFSLKHGKYIKERGSNGKIAEYEKT